MRGVCTMGGWLGVRMAFFSFELRVRLACWLLRVLPARGEALIRSVERRPLPLARSAYLAGDGAFLVVRVCCPCDSYAPRLLLGVGCCP